MYNIGKYYHHEEGHTKKDKLNNKSSQCHTGIYDSYYLYKYNIGIDYHHIRNSDEEGHKKEQVK